MLAEADSGSERVLVLHLGLHARLEGLSHLLELGLVVELVVVEQAVTEQVVWEEAETGEVEAESELLERILIVQVVVGLVEAEQVAPYLEAGQQVEDLLEATAHFVVVEADRHLEGEEVRENFLLVVMGEIQEVVARAGMFELGAVLQE